MFQKNKEDKDDKCSGVRTWHDGSGVVEVLQTNAAVIAKRVGEDIAVKYILDLRDFPGDPNADKVVHDYDIIDKDSDIQVVVECMGGVEPAILL